VPIALGFALLWACVIALGAFVLDSGALLALGAAGLALTVALPPLAHLQARFRALSVTDTLTGLANHRGFHETLASELQLARREGWPVAVIRIDLDDFKTVNDIHGHSHGDEVLRTVGHRLRGAVRTTDTAARIGGEEFGLILPGADSQQAYPVTTRARAAISEIDVDGVALSCSAGIASYPRDAEQGSSVFQLAAGALSWAKKDGKDRTRRFDPEHVPLAHTKRNADEIAALVEQPGAIAPLYQPVVALSTGQVVGYEALARFPDSPHRSPVTWFAQAHGCGMGPELEAAAIRAALEPIGRPVGTHLALNVSPSAIASQVVQQSLPRDLSDLVIEITEHEFVPEDDGLSAVVSDLRERGAQIAIDDAGAGYAGLKQVMRVRPDIVKLDRGLIDGISANPARMALVESFVRFARRIGAIVCAEGIESLDDLAVLGDLDVQWGQGFALAKPAKPWAMVSREAAEVCRAALAQALLASPMGPGTISAGDRRLEHVSARLASARSREDLVDALNLIALELHAEKVCISEWNRAEHCVETLAESGEEGEMHFNLADYPLTTRVLREQEAAQVLVTDPSSDAAEVELLLSEGHRSLLIVPIISRGESLGILEAYSSEERPWTRTEINRARIISSQFASVIHGIAHPAASGPDADSSSV
jgi:diguanylate cyclase (GGDEF)-like protein